MKQRKKIKCRHCGTFFYPNPHNIKNQHYCSKPDCRKASKVASQQKWVLKNPDYFRSRENVARVQAWRKKHPGYSKSKSKKYSNEPLQDSIIDKCLENQVVKEHLPTPALQDLISSQPLVLIGLIAKLTGFTLQDEIDLPFVIGRKNWLFAGSPEGARASALLYNLIESARINNLNQEKYLYFLLEKIIHVKEQDELLALLPNRVSQETIDEFMASPDRMP